MPPIALGGRVGLYRDLFDDTHWILALGSLWLHWYGSLGNGAKRRRIYLVRTGPTDRLDGSLSNLGFEPEFERVFP